MKVFPNSGLILTASEDKKCGAFFIPSLGKAPHFCSFIENFTEEFELKTSTNVMEKYKFVSFEELAALNANHLIGTK